MTIPMMFDPVMYSSRGADNAFRGIMSILLCINLARYDGMTPDKTIMTGLGVAIGNRYRKSGADTPVDHSKVAYSRLVWYPISTKDLT